MGEATLCGTRSRPERTCPGGLEERIRRPAARPHSGARLVAAPSSASSAGPPWDAGDIFRGADRPSRNHLMCMFCSSVSKDSKGGWNANQPLLRDKPQPISNATESRHTRPQKQLLSERNYSQGGKERLSTRETASLCCGASTVGEESILESEGALTGLPREDHEPDPACAAPVSCRGPQVSLSVVKTSPLRGRNTAQAGTSL